MFSIIAPSSETSRVFRYRSRFTGQTVAYYAERGIVRIVNETTGNYESVSRRDFLLRAQALSDSLRVKQPSDEKRDQQRLVATMVAAARAAGEQGAPLDPRTSKDAFAQAKAARPLIVAPNGWTASSTSLGGGRPGALDRFGHWDSSMVTDGPTDGGGD